MVRVVAASILLFGPWTDEASELDGWDADRFQQIADAPGEPYIDHDVEYPPGSVVIIQAIHSNDLVATHRRLVVLSLVADLGVAFVLSRRWSTRVAAAYLVIGLPMVPSGLLRLDLWAALAATIALAAIVPRSTGSLVTKAAGEAHHERRSAMPAVGSAVANADRPRAIAVFAVAAVIGSAIKLWPAFLIAAAIGIRRTRAAAVAGLLGVAVGVAWLAVSGFGALEQITSLRGATGWHVESIPGTLVSLFGDEPTRLEADAYRIGRLDDTVVLVGRLLTVAITVAAVVLARRRRVTSEPADVAALVMLAAVTTLVVTAPLVSPQFILWMTPWAAILHRDRLLLRLTAAALVLTAGVLATFGPPQLDHPIAAAGLLFRNGILVAIVGVALLRLARSDGLQHT